MEKNYRRKVRNAIADKSTEKRTVRLSQLLPAHPLEGNEVAENKNRERIAALGTTRLSSLIVENETIRQDVIEEALPSTSPMQLVFDRDSGKCVAFDGNSRLIAFKRFCEQNHPGIDPLMEVNAYELDPDEISIDIPWRDYSF